MRNVIFLLMLIGGLFPLFSQVTNDLCGNASLLCAGVPTVISNNNASSSVCNNCEDDFNFCFDPEATIWYSFETNASGGDVNIQITNIVFESNPGQGQNIQAAIISAVAPCDASTYSLVSNCILSGAANNTLTAVGLNPNATYYVVFGGDQSGIGITSPANYSADLMMSGTGVDRTQPTIGIVQSTTTPCLNDNVSFIASVQNCPDSSDYSWYVNGNLVAVTQDSFWVSSGFQTGDVIRVEIDCYTNCPITAGIDAQPLNVYSFLLDAGVDLYIDPGTSAQLSGFTSAGTYTWSPSFEVSNPTVLNPIVSPDETTVYSLTATENGCTQTDQVTVFVNSTLEIPNTFSPNDDGRNDLWLIEGINAYPNNHITIFTRWGQEIFNASSYSDLKAWDGKTRIGSKAAEGVYFYVLDLGDGSDLINGTINLIR